MYVILLLTFDLIFHTRVAFKCVLIKFSFYRALFNLMYIGNLFAFFIESCTFERIAGH